MKSLNPFGPSRFAGVILSIAILGLCPLACLGASKRLTAEAITQPEPASTNISRALWRPPGNQVSFLRPMERSGKTNSVLCAFEVESGQEVILLDPAGLPEKGRPTLSSYEWFPDGKAILITSENNLHRVEIPGARLTTLTQDGLSEELPLISPDGNAVAFVKSNDLYVVSVANRRVTRLTQDGSRTILNGKLDWVYDEEFNTVTGTARSFEWSPDSKQIVFLRLDQSVVPEHPITDFVSTHPVVTRQHYPKSGDTNARPSVAVVGINGGRARQMTLPPNTEYIVPEFNWTPDGTEVAVLTLNRKQNDFAAWSWKPGSRTCRLLVRDRDDTWINVFEGPRFLKRSRDFLWLSERDGFLHAYRYGPDGRMKHWLTKGAWQIEGSMSQAWSGRPLEIDPAEEWAYFSATENDPRERHVYRVRLDGTGFKRLTQDGGTHFQKLSQDGRHLLVSSSAVDAPPTIKVLRADGAFVATLDQRSDRWRGYTMPKTEFHEVKARDGTRLFGQLTRPSDFKPDHKYPVVVYVYGGPHAQVVRNVYGHVSTRNQLLAEAGFLVWTLDNRGSWGRGHAWESTVYKNCGTNELLDQLDGLAWLRTLPYVDTNRFGVWGWSYGGYMTLYMLTHAPDVFRCGVAGAPVTDWKFYDTIYTERYMGTPRDNPTGYKTSSPLAAAGRLKSKVLIIHGTADDNVHLHNTLNFVDALVKRGAPHELHIQPGQMHGFTGREQTRLLAGQIVDFFERHLGDR